jgi:hypothetical protein
MLGVLGRKGRRVAALVHGVVAEAAVAAAVVATAKGAEERGSAAGVGVHVVLGHGAVERVGGAQNRLGELGLGGVHRDDAEREFDGHQRRERRAEIGDSSGILCRRNSATARNGDEI